MAREGAGGGGDMRLGRWERLFEDAYDVGVWKAISLKENLEASDSDKLGSPSDNDSKVSLERVLNPAPAPPPPRITTIMSIPVLNDPIFLVEVQKQI